MSNTNLSNTGSLSAYQVAILDELLSGKTQKQIADDRGIHPASISEQLSAAKSKTQTLTTYHLVYVYAQHKAYTEMGNHMDANGQWEYAQYLWGRAAGMLP